MNAKQLHTYRNVLEEEIDKRSYADRFKTSVSPHILDIFPAAKSPWAETKEEIDAALEWGKTKSKLMKWVRQQIKKLLTKKQAAAIRYHYLETMTFAECGLKMGCSASAACRSVQRGIERLRERARIELGSQPILGGPLRKPEVVAA